MTPLDDPASLGSDDPAVVEALQEYRAAVAAGHKPNRKEFLARYPQTAGTLDQCLDALDFVQGAAAELSSDWAASPVADANEPAPGTPLGDFRLLRQVGRGGMGIVYEAEQLSLGRRVALKVLPFASALDTRQLLRFQNEARAAALLRHPHIVAVHAVGCERGVHYYVMDFVDGRNLAEVVQARRTQRGLTREEEIWTDAPTRPEAAAATDGLLSEAAFPRTAARWAMQTAEALDHAHQLGIIHRDVKPANLLIDMAGDLWVTDFGLAFVHESTRLTRTGDFVGTLRYMSPEQTRAGSEVVDHRTDIYSLGVTLYELLTLEHAFGGRDPQDVLRRIGNEEPWAPRRHNRTIPADLETIVLKAMAKNRDERYATARELADDLNQFLHEEPIRARRPSLVQELRRWARRRRAVVTAALVSAAFLLLAGAAAFAVSYVQVRWALQRETQAKNQLATTLDHQDHLLYYHRIALAHREWLANDVRRAEKLLDDCPAPLRQWEWNYLKGLCHGEVAVLRDGPAGGCLAFHSGSRRLAVAGQDGSLRVLDADTWGELVSWRPHERNIRRIAYSPDGRHLATASFDGTAKVLDAATGQPLVTIPQRGGAVAFSPDGKWVATGTASREVTVWDVAAGHEVLTLRGHAWDVVAVAFRPPDGKHLAALSADGSVRCWDVAERKEMMCLAGPPGGGKDLVYDPDGLRLAAVGGEGTVKLWHAGSGELLRTQQCHAAVGWCAAFSPDGRLFATASRDQTVKVWDPATGEERGTFRGHRDAVIHVAFHPDGRHLISTGNDGTVRVWDVTANPEAFTYHSDRQSIGQVAVTRGGRCLMTVHDDRVLEVRDVRNGHVLFQRPEGGKGLRAFLSAGGGRLACLPREGAMEVWDVASGVLVSQRLPTVAKPALLHLSPDGGRVAATERENVLHVWELPSGQEVFSRAGPVRIASAAFSPDGRLLAHTNQGGAVHVWDLDRGEELWTSPPGSVAQMALAFSADGGQLAWQERDVGVHVVELQTGRLLLTLPGTERFLQSFAFSPDDRRLATASGEQMIALWDLATGFEVLTLRGHRQDVSSVTFSPDGRYLVSLSRDNTVKIWDGGPPP